MVHANYVIAIIVILHITIGVLLGICICYIRRRISPPDSITDSTISTDDTSYITKVPARTPAPAPPPPPPPPPPTTPPPPWPPDDGAFNLLPPRSGSFNFPRRTGDGASAHRKIAR
ncbi:hypothetical protein A9K55_005440 [Cordyceps militaris]|uniref:Uncharacterized protein n=1 Tax=Cordyceps militaris TaxID=73501 RepID=A0A2H4SAS9_CORMI|nr:hypothetical protein A9K55_005440 [Cordyceps militaris]